MGTDPDGYVGAAFDGEYVYFAPSHNGTERHGEVLRYNTAGNFDDANSWATYDPGADIGHPSYWPVLGWWNAEALWDIIGDKILAIEFRVKVRWEDRGGMMEVLKNKLPHGSE